MASSSQLGNRRSRRRKPMVAAADFYLPLECWERIITFLIDHNHSFKSLSIVSKQFLSITNRFRFSATITDQTLPKLLFNRFTNLTSLNFTRLCSNLNKLLRGISCFPLNITSLNLSNQYTIPVNGLRDFSKKITTLTSFTCSNTCFIDNTDIFHISNCFPLLEELDLSNTLHYCKTGQIDHLSLTFFKLRKINLSGHQDICDELLFHLFKSCKLLEEAIILTCLDITFDGLASAIRERPTLRSLSFSNTYAEAQVEEEESYITSNFIASLMSLKYLTCLDLLSSNITNELLSSIVMEGLPLTRLGLQDCIGYSYSGIFGLLSKYQHLQHLDLQNAVFLNDKRVMELSLFLGDLISINLSGCSMLTLSAFYALIKNCPSLNDIKMERTSIGINSSLSSKSSKNFPICPQLKYLRLAHNPWLSDQNIITFASIFPNLQLLDLSKCLGLCDKGIAQVLRICCNIRHLNLSYCSIGKLRELNFKVPKLEVLNLSNTQVDDETLYVISMRCRGLSQLLLNNCTNFTEKGVRHVRRKVQAT